MYGDQIQDTDWRKLERCHLECGIGTDFLSTGSASHASTGTGIATGTAFISLRWRFEALYPSKSGLKHKLIVKHMREMSTFRDGVTLSIGTL
jgi:hypothetical protein